MTDPMVSICSPEMPRRAFMAVIAGGLLAAPVAAQAQPAGKVWRIGVLSSGSPSGSAVARVDAFKQGLRELGYVEGQNTVIESRWGAGKYESLPGLAAELVRLKMDAILTAAVPAIRSCQGSDQYDPHHHGGRCGSGGDWSRRQPRAAGRKHHRAISHDP
jgi:putative ABC transport system substrate-binding protein